jgi:hypothetical protein
MNRVGRRTTYAMLVVLALAIVWQVRGRCRLGNGRQLKYGPSGAWGGLGP